MKRKVLDLLDSRMLKITGSSDAEKALELRKEIGMLNVAREHSLSEQDAHSFLRPVDNIDIEHETVDFFSLPRSESYTLNQLLESFSVEELEKLRRQKKAEFGEIVSKINLENSSLDKQKRRNLELAIREYREDSSVPEEVGHIVEGEDGLRMCWSEAESFDEVEDQFVEMIETYRDFSGGDYEKVLSIWESNLDLQEVDTALRQILDQVIEILENLEPEQVRSVWREVDDSIDEDLSLEDLTDNSVGLHEFLTNYVLDGNPVKMPVRIGSSGMEYGNSLMAPLQTTDHGFWAKCFDTTAHEFGHTVGRAGLDSENAFLPLGEPPSEAVDEGMARFYQNHVFRSKEFLTSEGFGFVDKIKEWTGIQKQDGYDEKIYSWFNAIDPENKQRVSASPLTYPVHIYVRYELERELIESNEPVEKIVSELDERWENKMREYLFEPLGVEIDGFSDSETVLQDVHWGKGKVGYFPSYTVGDIMAANWKQEMQDEMDGDVSDYIAEGEIQPVNDWLVENVFSYGKDYENNPHTETDPKAFVQWLKSVREDIYS